MANQISGASSQPRFMRKERFFLVGAQRYTDNGQASIVQAWDELLERLDEIPDRSEPAVMIGFEDYSRGCELVPGQMPKFHYIAAAEVDRITDVPDGLFSKEVQEAEYAVFSLRGPLSNISGLFRYIYDEWLPASEYRLDPQMMADFEYYREPVNDRNDARVDIYIPIVPK
ncbi:GyrI-like domain-containing protein [Cohnella faecalis]|nr:GyrI-like domain-containing protein [Cohnella faecalis]